MSVTNQKSHLNKNLLIDEHADDVTGLVYDDLDSSGDILCGDGGVNFVIWNTPLTPNGDSKED